MPLRGTGSCRTEAKIALFCNVDKDAVFSAVDVSNIYELPLKLYEEGLDQKVAIMLRLPARNAKLEAWEQLVYNVKNPQGRVTIAIVGKYVELKEAYKSLHEALVHGGIANRVAVDLRYVNSEEVTAENVAETFRGADGILVPGGFGIAAWKERSNPSVMPARTAFPSSASASACSARSSSSPDCGEDRGSQFRRIQSADFRQGHLSDDRMV